MSKKKKYEVQGKKMEQEIGEDKQNS